VSELLALALVLALMIGVYALMFRSTTRGRWLIGRINDSKPNYRWGARAITGLVTLIAIISILEIREVLDVLVIGCGFAGITWILCKGQEVVPLQVSADLFYGAVGAVAFYGVVADFIWGVDVEQRTHRIVLLALFCVVSALAWAASFFTGHINLTIGLTLFAIVEVLSYIASPLGTDLLESRGALILSFIAAIVLGALAGRGKELVEGAAVVSIAVFHALALSMGINPNTASSATTNDYTTLMAMIAYLMMGAIILRLGARK
jgi:hypothetical protein